MMSDSNEQSTSNQQPSNPQPAHHPPRRPRRDRDESDGLRVWRRRHHRRLRDDVSRRDHARRRRHRSGHDVPLRAAGAGEGGLSHARARGPHRRGSVPRRDAERAGLRHAAHARIRARQARRVRRSRTSSCAPFMPRDVIEAGAVPRRSDSGHALDRRRASDWPFARRRER